MIVREKRFNAVKKRLLNFKNNFILVELKADFHPKRNTTESILKGTIRTKPRLDDRRKKNMILILLNSQFGTSLILERHSKKVMNQYFPIYKKLGYIYIQFTITQ